MRIFGGGTVFTGVRQAPWAESVAIRGATIVGVGPLDELRDAWPSATEETSRAACCCPASSMLTTTSCRPVSR